MRDKLLITFHLYLTVRVSPTFMVEGKPWSHEDRCELVVLLVPPIPLKYSAEEHAAVSIPVINTIRTNNPTIETILL